MTWELLYETTLCLKKVNHLVFDNNFGKCGPNSKCFHHWFVRKLSMYISTSPAMLLRIWNSKIQKCYQIFTWQCLTKIYCQILCNLPQKYHFNHSSNFDQVANLLCAQANSASYPRRDGKWVVAMATGWRPSVADWGDGVSADCTVGPIVRKRGQWMAT